MNAEMTKEQHSERRIEDMDTVQSAIEGLSSKNMFVRSQSVDTLGNYCQNSPYHKVCVIAAQALADARGHEDTRVAESATEWLKGLKDYGDLPRGFVIKPHKGGRSQRIYARVTPEVKAYLESKSESVSDWIERKIKEEKPE